MSPNNLSKVIRLVVGVALVAAVMLFAGPARPAAAGGPGIPPPQYFCFLNGMIETGPYSDPSGFPGKVIVFGPTPLPNGQTVTSVLTEISLISGTTWNATATIHISGCNSIEGFADGRCNLDAGQNLTVYPDGKGGLYFYAIYDSKGYFAMHVTAADLKANPAKGSTYLIRSSLGVSLYRLADGGLQVMRAKGDGTNYTFIITSSCAGPV